MNAIEFCVTRWQACNEPSNTIELTPLLVHNFSRKMEIILSAEGAGFEPAVEFNPYDGLANRWFQPLTHPSERIWNAEIKRIEIYIFHSKMETKSSL